MRGEDRIDSELEPVPAPSLALRDERTRGDERIRLAHRLWHISNFRRIALAMPKPAPNRQNGGDPGKTPGLPSGLGARPSAEVRRRAIPAPIRPRTCNPLSRTSVTPRDTESSINVDFPAHGRGRRMRCGRRCSSRVSPSASFSGAAKLARRSWSCSTKHPSAISGDTRCGEKCQPRDNFLVPAERAHLDSTTARRRGGTPPSGGSSAGISCNTDNSNISLVSTPLPPEGGVPLRCRCCQGAPRRNGLFCPCGVGPLLIQRPERAGRHKVPALQTGVFRGALANRGLRSAPARAII